MLQVLSWMMTHPAHGLLATWPFFFIHCIFLNDRLKCFCPHYNSHSHRGDTVFLKK